MNNNKNRFLAKLIFGICLAFAGATAQAALIKYQFFSYVSGQAIAFGGLDYNTRLDQFVAGDIYTTPSYDFLGNLAHPGAHYTQVNLLTYPTQQYALSIWEESATGVIGDRMMYISFIPYQLPSLARLEVGRGVEGKCASTWRANGCLVSNDRIMYLGAGRALATEVIPLAEPPGAWLMLIGLLLLLAGQRLRRAAARAERRPRRPPANRP